MDKKELKKVKELKKLKKEWEKLPFFNEEQFQNGLKVARLTTKNWNKQDDPPKVFIFGKRVHHGLGGLATVVLAVLGRDSFGLGYGYGLIVDDIADSDEWFNFENGGDLNKLISFE